MSRKKIGNPPSKILVTTLKCRCLRINKVFEVFVEKSGTYGIFLSFSDGARAKTLFAPLLYIKEVMVRGSLVRFALNFPRFNGICYKEKKNTQSGV